ncbi:MAG: hypothetical protein NC231_07885 [Bacillus sp. (in: Bacteria)]|nr:hypothetical protein [Bacillus sp. (in: firmicutes)]
MNKVMNIMIAALSVVLFLQIFLFAGYVLERELVYGYDSDEEDLVNDMKYQDYDNLLNAVHQNEAMGVQKEGEMEALYAVAYYYENAMMYHAYRTAGDREKAQQRYDKMLEYEMQMGEYSFAKEEILDYLGIE